MSLLTHLLLITVCLSVTPSTALQCYTCEKTVKTVDRFTKEETETLQCSEDPEDWTVETCLDQREFCSKGKTVGVKGKSVFISDVVKYDRGCAIPKDPYFSSSVEDSLDSGGNSICWYKIFNVRSYSGDAACFCNTDLCNQGGRHPATNCVIIIFLL